MSVAAADSGANSGQQKNPSIKLIEGFFLVHYCGTEFPGHAAS
jgi:hypothetical protein